MFALAGVAYTDSLATTNSAPATLRVAITQEPTSVNPLTGTLVVDNDVVALVYDGLTRFDDHGRQIPDLAERVPTLANGGISRDGRTITYRLVPNARWHDGVAVTSKDVVFSLAAYRDPRLGSVSNSTLNAIDRIEASDSRTVRIILKRPWAPALAAFAGGSEGVILPEHLLASAGDPNRVDFVNPAFGNGPFILTAWHRGTDMMFDANPSYFRGAPHIAHIRLSFLVDDNTMLTAMRTGDVDLADNITSATYDAARTVVPMVAAMNARSSWDHLAFNTEKAPLSDVRVRRALCYGFDLTQLFEKVYHGLGVIGPVAENPRTLWYNRRLRPYPYDPARAGALLDAAGWHLGRDGIREKNGRRLSLTLSTVAGNHSREQVEVFLQSMWSAIGVEAAIKNANAAVLYAPAASGGPLYGGKFDISINGLVSPIDPSLRDTNGADAIPPSGQNLSFFRNTEITRLEDEGASTYDLAKRKRIYDRIQEIELKDLPYYVLRWNEIISMHSVKLNGVRPSSTESTFWNVAKWWLAG